FFQAEDGIRDDLVTGVQTCALPIYRRRVMQEPVQYRRGDDRVAENRTPVTVALVRGQEDTAALVPPADELEEDRGPQIVQRQVTHFINHQNLGGQIDPHPPVQPTFAIGFPQVRGQIVRGDEIGGEARLNRCGRQRHTQVCLLALRKSHCWPRG